MTAPKQPATLDFALGPDGDFWNKSGPLSTRDRKEVERRTNAYPQLVERQQKNLAALGEVDAALQAMGHYGLGKMLREEMSATQALLRELGEES